MKDWAISSENDVYDNLAYTIGFLLGDGSLDCCPYKDKNGVRRFHNNVVFVCSDEEPILRVQQQLEAVFDYKYSINSRILKSGLKHWRIAIGRRDAFDWFSVNTNWKGKVPDYYFSADNEVKKEVIRGLMDSDGHCAEFVDTFRGKDKGVKRWTIGFSNNKIEIINNCAALMQMVGIKVGKIAEGKKKGYRATYMIRPNPRSFHEAGMFFYASRKQEKFDRYVEHVIGSETLRATPSI